MSFKIRFLFLDENNIGLLSQKNCLTTIFVVDLILYKNKINEKDL